MSASKNIILYLASGVRYINQALYSIASLINVYKGKIPSDLRVLVYTDDINAFKNIKSIFTEVDCVLLTKQQTYDWAGPSNYMLRLKPKVMEDALSRFVGNIMFVDTDTIFKKKVDGLFKNIKTGNFVLHTKEWMLSHGMKQWGLVVISKPRNIQVNDGADILINNESFMWNSGVVGVSYEKKSVLKLVLSLLDKLIAEEPHYLTEQLTWSVVLKSKGALTEAKNQIYHYWDNKEVLDAHIAEILEKSGHDFNKFLHFVNPSIFLEEPLQQKVVKKLKGIVSGILKKS